MGNNVISYWYHAPISDRPDRTEDISELGQLKQRLKELELWALREPSDNHADIIMDLRARIKLMEKQLRETEEDVETETLLADSAEKISIEFESLFTSLRIEGVIKGSSKDYTPHDLISRINRLRCISNSRPLTLDDYSTITQANGLRAKVYALIKRSIRVKNER